jgi:hypothetical protein
MGNSVDTFDDKRVEPKQMKKFLYLPSVWLPNTKSVLEKIKMQEKEICHHLERKQVLLELLEHIYSWLSKDLDLYIDRKLDFEFSLDLPFSRYLKSKFFKEIEENEKFSLVSKFLDLDKKELLISKDNYLDWGLEEKSSGFTWKEKCELRGYITVQKEIWEKLQKNYFKKEFNPLVDLFMENFLKIHLVCF